ncbi:DUF4132 domain-containing protein [Janthinobacterium aquaticum]|uniref:DUF4132 domain-containing protein n=1 Tax=Janthinobacterium sp. FT58W TaxID=2654254 RepID=UPI0012644A1B|nr:DUF4132 domain-containing protein [Janthinobacterium sp. FT58W]KAB8044364.1 DUF4132 domain-containing protein [Janthinobacterium sp. FT58W]
MVRPLGEEVLQLLRSNQRELLQRLQKEAQAEAEKNLSARFVSHSAQQALSECAALDDAQLSALSRWFESGDVQAAACFALPQGSRVLSWKGRLAAFSGVDVLHMARWVSTKVQYGHRFWHDDDFEIWLARQPAGSVDLRQLDAALREAGDLRDGVALACLSDWGSFVRRPQAVLPPDCVWPFFEQRPELIDQGLGLAPDPRSGYDRLRLDYTLDVLQTYRQLPQRWLPALLDFALGDLKPQRIAAQRILARSPDIAGQVAASLASGRQEVRMRAARWLGELGDPAVVPALYGAVQRERRETVSAALLSALERLGEDIAPLLAPDKLLAEARKGLQAKMPAGLEWFDFAALPDCCWGTGSPLAPEILRWWVVLACKLKEPRANPMLMRYLDLLHPDSRAALGLAVLRQFITHDTQGADPDAAIAHANQYYVQRHGQYQQLAREYPEAYGYLGTRSMDRVFEELRLEALGDCTGSAIGQKGILALACHAPGERAVALLQTYMRDHYLRRAQIEALLECLAAGSDTALVQLLLGVARRYRTASVQDKARLLIEQVAADKGWSAWQLADRTLPTGGLDESGALMLDYAGRPYRVTLDAAIKPVLHNAEGKLVAALPEPREHDAPVSIKEARQRLSNCKKEVKQVLVLQTARLYEAMCLGRRWSVADWRDDLLRHPVASRLLQQLVWQELGPDGAERQLFRPVEDGSLLDADDQEIALAADSEVRLAHAILLTAAQVAAWKRHLGDYRQKLLFEQLQHALPPAALRAGAHIDDRQGWLSDSFTLRTAFGKRGYAREAAGDGGVFEAYCKDFPGGALCVRMRFSGSQLPEERRPVALMTLAFQSLPDGHPVALSTVPPVLLAEAYADYHAVAKVCGGHDEDWESTVAF